MSISLCPAMSLPLTFQRFSTRLLFPNRDHQFPCIFVNKVSYATIICLQLRIVTLVYKEQRYASHHGIFISASKFCHREVLLPVVLQVVHVGLKLYFQNGVNSLCLCVHQCVKSH